LLNRRNLKIESWGFWKGNGLDSIKEGARRIEYWRGRTGFGMGRLRFFMDF
jgi:hypothetical protein